MDLDQYEERLNSFLKAINEDKDYIQAHDIGREMLLSGENKDLAKLFASIAGLAQQFSKAHDKGYWKFRKMVIDRMMEMPNHPFDEEFLIQQLNQLDQVMEKQVDSKSPLEKTDDEIQLKLLIKLKE